MAVNDRFKDAPWINPDIATIVGGAGGIGSWLTLFLSRIGYEVSLFDDDVFEEHNVGGQFVNMDSIGNPKVSVVQQLAVNFGAMGHISALNEKYTEESFAHLYMLAAFDNMAARKVMFERWFSYNSQNRNSHAIFIDGRLTMEQIQIFCVTPRTTKDYRENHLFDDTEVEDTACTMKQTSHSAAIIAGLMTGFFTNHIANVMSENDARAVPYQYEYFIPLNLQNDKF